MGAGANTGAGGCGGKQNPVIVDPDVAGGEVRCVRAFKNRGYSGSRMTFCTDGSQTGEFLDDEFSSFELDEGTVVKVCVDSDAEGECRSYYRSVPRVGGPFEDDISFIEIEHFNPEDFKMIFASDPQLFWSECTAGFKEDCANKGGDPKTIALETNGNHVNAMNALGNVYGEQLVGLIVNGDLTAYGHDGELSAFREFYEEKLEMNLWAGLGNHDYENNVDDCLENDCARNMLDYMGDYVEGYNAHSVDWSVSSGYDFPSNNKYHRGSLSYSWSIGGVRFVQLHNHPGYTVELDSWHWSGADRHHYTIEPSWSYLREELREANSRGERVVLNFHDRSGGFSARGDDDSLTSVLRDLGQNVVAIMVGHLHPYIGQRGRMRNFGHRAVPVFFGGSALYQRFLLVGFKGDLMEVQVVDSRGGRAYELQEVDSYDISLD